MHEPDRVLAVAHRSTVHLVPNTLPICDDTSQGAFAVRLSFRLAAATADAAEGTSRRRRH